MRSSTSALMVSGEAMKRSSVCATTPSVEFSTGTTPYSARPRSTSSKTASIDANGSSSAPEPNCSPPPADE